MSQCHLLYNVKTLCKYHGDHVITPKGQHNKVHLSKPQMADLPVNNCKLYQIYMITGQSVLSE